MGGGVKEMGGFVLLMESEVKQLSRMILSAIAKENQGHNGTEESGVIFRQSKKKE